MMVRVRDLSAGVLEVFVGDKRIELRDGAIASAIAAAGLR
jgi:hypothetical protein